MHERLAGLDGLRGAAAVYVVIHHVWLQSFRDYPIDRGPFWLSWALYGRLAVVLFLVLSGFSLAASAAANGWTLGGLGRFIRRRAWRILPPYWAALVFSLVVAWAIVPASRAGGPPTFETVVVYTLLLQDLIWAPTPNGAFWSIGVEAGLYLCFPLMLILRRWFGPAVMLAAVTTPVIVFGLMAPGRLPGGNSLGLTFELAPLFAIGIVAAGVIYAKDWVRNLPWHWFAALAAAPILALMVLNGSVWTVERYYWIDLAVGPAMAMMIAAIATGRPVALMRILTSAPLQFLGTCSYSLYLVHAPIMMVISRRFTIPTVGRGLDAFVITFILAVPLSLLVAWIFALIFEIPFQRYRSWGAVMGALRAWWARVGLGGPRTRSIPGVKAGTSAGMTAGMTAEPAAGAAAGPAAGAAAGPAAGASAGSAAMAADTGVGARAELR